MTSFCVFGVKRSDCIKAARKIMPIRISYGNHRQKMETVFTQSQWAEFSELLADHMFEESKKQAQARPAFDAPQFAMDWLEIARKSNEIRNHKLMARGEKKDKKGDLVIKKGKPVIGWVSFDESMVGLRK